MQKNSGWNQDTKKYLYGITKFWNSCLKNDGHVSDGQHFRQLHHAEDPYYMAAIEMSAVS